MRYAILDNPSLLFSTLLGLQQVLTMLGATVSIIFISGENGIILELFFFFQREKTRDE